MPVASLDVLAAREQQVLSLVADVKDNQTIAAALDLSVRTVERHLSHCYTKLGLAGRSASHRGGTLRGSDRVDLTVPISG